MKKKFNIIDILILVVIIAVVVGGVCFFHFRKNEVNSVEDNIVKLNFTLEVRNLDKETAEFFKEAIDKSAHFGKTSSGSGRVTDVQIMPYQTLNANVVTGEYVLNEIEDKYNVHVVITSDVVKTETAYTSGNEVIAVGKLMPFNSFGIASEDTYIVDLEEVK